MSTPAQRAAQRALEALKDRIRTHHMPAPVSRKGNPSESQRMASARIGRRTGRIARLRKPLAPA